VAKLLGEVLLQTAIIGESQLQEALDAQLVYGGHLGTCLIELGYIDEENLGQVLAETFSVKYVAPELLRNIPNEIIEIFSRSLVEKYQAIPFGRTEKGIHVAMINPQNLAALDEISFVSSHRSIPWVSPELRVLQAMERYYGTTRKLRYVTIFRQLDNQRSNTEEPGKGGRAPASLPQEGIEVALAGREQEEEEEGLLAQRVTGKLNSPVKTSEAGASTHDPEDIIVHLSGLSVEPMHPVVLVRDDDLPEADGSSEDPSLSLDDRLCMAETGEDVADLILNEAALSLPHCLFFLIKRSDEFVCSSRGISLEPDQTTGLRTNAALGRIFQLLCQNLNYCGEIPDTDEYQDFYNILQMEFPRELLILPIYLKGRLFSVFYGDSGPSEKIKKPVEHYSKLMKKLALTLHLMLIKRKLRTF